MDFMMFPTRTMHSCFGQITQNDICIHLHEVRSPLNVGKFSALWNTPQPPAEKIDLKKREITSTPPHKLATLHNSTLCWPNFAHSNPGWLVGLSGCWVGSNCFSTKDKSKDQGSSQRKVLPKIYEFWLPSLKLTASELVGFTPKTGWDWKTYKPLSNFGASIYCLFSGGFYWKFWGMYVILKKTRFGRGANWSQTLGKPTWVLPFTHCWMDHMSNTPNSQRLFGLDRNYQYIQFANLILEKWPLDPSASYHTG